MQPRSETEVLVVGAGPVGMLTAACLAKQGIRVQIVEQGYRPAARSYALALHPETLRILDGLGLARLVIDRGKIIDTVAFYEGEKRRAELKLARLETPFPYVLVMAQSALEEILAAHLKTRGVEVCWNHRGAELKLGRGMVGANIEPLADESAGYGLTAPRSPGVQPIETHAHFVIGADGYRSTVRRALAIEYDQVGDAQTFGVFEFQSPWNPEGEVRVVLDSWSTSVLWPLGGQRLRFSFELTEAQQSSPRLKRRLLMQMGEEAFPYIAQELLEEIIAERAPWFTAPVQDVAWSVAVRFDRQLVPSFGRGNAWLVGDAAHLAGPVGVQSMNVGMREAEELAQKLHAILREEAPYDVLDTYNDERLAEWRTLYSINGKPGFNDNISEWVAMNAPRILPTVPASGADLSSLMEQIGLEIPTRQRTS